MASRCYSGLACSKLSEFPTLSTLMALTLLTPKFGGKVLFSLLPTGCVAIRWLMTDAVKLSIWFRWTDQFSSLLATTFPSCKQWVRNESLSLVLLLSSSILLTMLYTSSPFFIFSIIWFCVCLYTWGGHRATCRSQFFTCFLETALVSLGLVVSTFTHWLFYALHF